MKTLYGFIRIMTRILSYIYDKSIGVEFSNKKCCYRWNWEEESINLQLKNLFYNPLSSWPINPIEFDFHSSSIIRHMSILKHWVEKSLEHKFSILGSNWIDIGYNAQSKGWEGVQYDMQPGKETELKQLFSMAEIIEKTALFINDGSVYNQDLINTLKRNNNTDSYSPIDWHCDHRSGYRWNPDSWYMHISPIKGKGIDIKTPWEISRFQHTIWMALYDGSNVDKQHINTKLITKEWILQVIDWITANKYRHGVNWRSAMDISIQSANWIWGLSFFQNSPWMTDAVKFIIIKNLYYHGLHIERNLDYYKFQPTSNHYLADIVGLLYISLAFPFFPESDRWLLFSLQELVSEMENTVNPDGSNYEDSTHYHRLVTEMFLHGTIQSLKIPKQRRDKLKKSNNFSLNPFSRLRSFEHQQFDLDRKEIFPDFYWQRLEKMLEFTYTLTKPNGLIPILGDNDNGRFVKITPVAFKESEEGEFLEEFRDHRHLLAVGGFLFNRKDFLSISENYLLDAKILLNDITSDTCKNIDLNLYDSHIAFRHNVLNYINQANYRSRETKNNNLIKNKISLFSNAGISIYRKESIWMVIKCCCNGIRNRGGHSHIDKLSFELNVNGKDIIVDPGTYVYTPFTEWRQRLRSIYSHNIWYFDTVDVHTLSGDLFKLIPCREAKVIHADEEKWLGKYVIIPGNIEFMRLVFFENKNNPKDILLNDNYLNLFQEIKKNKFREIQWSVYTEDYVIRFVDFLIGEFPMSGMLNLHFSPDCDVRKVGEHEISIYKEKIRFVFPDYLSINLGESRYCPRYGDYRIISSLMAIFKRSC